MRVIAGTAKGVRLGPVPAGTRPLSDRAREGLFASLASDVLEARCLDLFAGTGAVGIEALSRGASHCTFVDRTRAATVAIRSNLRKARLEALAEVVTTDVVGFLARALPPEGPFDLVFLDPPYDIAIGPLQVCLGALAEGWLAPGEATVVMTRGHKSPLPAVPLHWTARRQLRYGDSLLFLYREV
ncbi:MAG: 16S rRNA (guanine(966)-N(2))-methyltransferase RsmD [Planctomycetaceae bacterium]